MSDPVQAAGSEQEHPSGIGVVVIGRNEGMRLRRCLESLRSLADRTVYVDSGSHDESVAVARSLGVTPLELDPGVPFTAARARNEGLELLLWMHPSLEYVLFVDGDCEVAQTWPEAAAAFIRTRSDLALVWGRRREKHPERSIYNRLCDLEWKSVDVGETHECGGDALIRVAALRQVHGYRPDLICGEEPELCVRLHRAGWRIWRLNEEMTVHDAAMYNFHQWWRRMQRGGYAFAQGAHLHGDHVEAAAASRSHRIWIWGLAVPLAVIIAAAAIGPWALCLLALYPLQIARIALRGRHGRADNWLHAAACVIGKFPEMLGQVRFVKNSLTRVQARLIEYK